MDSAACTECGGSGIDPAGGFTEAGGHSDPCEPCNGTGAATAASPSLAELIRTGIGSIGTYVTETGEPVTREGKQRKAALEALDALLDENERLRTRGGIARSILTVRHVERFHRRCEELGV